MGQIDERLKKIEGIAHSKIPVSEESFMFELFFERRHICKQFKKDLTVNDRICYTEYLEVLENKIKSCLYL